MQDIWRKIGVFFFDQAVGVPVRLAVSEAGVRRIVCDAHQRAVSMYRPEWRARFGRDGEGSHLMTARAERLRQAGRVHLGAGPLVGRSAVDELENTHAGCVAE